MMRGRNEFMDTVNISKELLRDVLEWADGYVYEYYPSEDANKKLDEVRRLLETQP
jgi:hypothetical protein